MARETTGSLFDDPSGSPTAPLAERMRPTSLAEFVGQSHLVGEGAPLRRVMAGGKPLPSLILWGGPGSGKTTSWMTAPRSFNTRTASSMPFFMSGVTVASLPSYQWRASAILMPSIGR